MRIRGALLRLPASAPHRPTQADFRDAAHVLHTCTFRLIGVHLFAPCLSITRALLKTACLGRDTPCRLCLSAPAHSAQIFGSCVLLQDDVVVGEGRVGMACPHAPRLVGSFHESVVAGGHSALCRIRTPLAGMAVSTGRGLCREHVPAHIKIAACRPVGGQGDDSPGRPTGEARGAPVRCV